MKRVVLGYEKQRGFMKRVLGKETKRKFLKTNNLDVPYHTFAKYVYGKITIPLELFDKLCRIGSVDKSKMKLNIVDDNWGAIKGGKTGIKALHKSYRLELINSWRSKGGKNSNAGGRGIKKIKEFDKIGEQCAELIGIFLGDGTLTTNFIRVSGDRRWDNNYFCHISCMIRYVFGLSPKVRYEKRKNTFYLEVSSVDLCKKLHEYFGLPFGNKIRGKAKISHRILDDDGLSISCLRGLVDTDGSVCRRGKSICLAFNSKNPILLEQAWNIGSKLGVFSHKFDYEIGTNSVEKIERYFSLVGSSNMRHIIRFLEWRNNKVALYMEDVPRYFNKYKNITLPYKSRWSSGKVY